MKRFITAVLFASVFFIGLGAIVKTTGAKFKSDEKALDLIRKARQAIGGDNAIAGVQSLRIVGRTTKTFKIDGTERTEEGETQIAMQLPDKLMKMMKLGHGDGVVGGNPIIEKQVDVVVVGAAKDKMKVTVDGSPDGQHKIIVRNDDGTVQELTGAEAEKMIARDGAQRGGDVHKLIG